MEYELQIFLAGKDLEAKSRFLERGAKQLGQEGSAVVYVVIDCQEEARKPRRFKSVLTSVADSGDEFEGALCTASAHV